MFYLTFVTDIDNIYFKIFLANKEFMKALQREFFSNETAAYKRDD